MFELQRQQASIIIAKLQYCIEQDYEKVPDSQKLSGQEFNLWQETTGRIITHNFGIKSAEIKRWEELAKGAQEKIFKAIARGEDDPQSLLKMDLIYMNSAINLLNELEVYLKQRGTDHPKDFQQVLLNIFWQSSLGKVFLLLLLVIIAVFTVWQSLPDEIKAKLLLAVSP
jgi:hypothetical protein